MEYGAFAARRMAASPLLLFASGIVVHKIRSVSEIEEAVVLGAILTLFRRILNTVVGRSPIGIV